MNVDQLIARWKGKPLDVDGFPPDQPFQCFDLFIQAVREATPDKGFYVVCRSTGLAQDLYNDFASNGLGKYFDRIPASQPPKKNDVAIWGQSKPAPLSHVAIVMGDLGSSLQVFQQNAPYPYCSIGNYTKTGLLGYLRFKGGEEMIENNDLWFARMSQVVFELTGETLSRNEFGAFVGRSPWDVTTNILDDRNRVTQNEVKSADVIAGLQRDLVSATQIADIRHNLLSNIASAAHVSETDESKQADEVVAKLKGSTGSFIPVTETLYREA